MSLGLKFPLLKSFTFRLIFPRDKQTETEDDSLAGSLLQLKRSSLTPSEKQEDADNQKNSTRASQAALNSNAVHIPVTITAPPGETTIIPSEGSISQKANDPVSFSIKFIF